MESLPESAFDVFIHPGEWFFGDADTRIRTVLGSCVAIVLWHPQQRIGGMCHYMLPGRGQPRPADAPLDGRYADEAIDLLCSEIHQARTRVQDYQVKLFGGGNMFLSCEKPIATAGPDVPRRNVSIARELLQEHGFKAIAAEHVGGGGHRNVVFDVWSGDVWMRHNPAKCNKCGQTPVSCPYKRQKLQA